MRKIDLIVVHCSDSDIASHDNIETIRKWHVNERGWSDIGYHYFISKDGAVHIGRQLSLAGSHVRGYNARSIGICLSGRNRFTDEQFKSLERLCRELVSKYKLTKLDILAHHDLDKGKTCPNFKVSELVAGWNL